MSVILALPPPFDSLLGDRPMTVVRAGELLRSLATRTQTDALVTRDRYAQAAARATLFSQESGSPNPSQSRTHLSFGRVDRVASVKLGRVHRQSLLGEPWIKLEMIVRSARPGPKAETVAHCAFRECEGTQPDRLRLMTRNVFNLRRPREGTRARARLGRGDGLGPPPRPRPSG